MDARRSHRRFTMCTSRGSNACAAGRRRDVPAGTAARRASSHFEHRGFAFSRTRADGPSHPPVAGRWCLVRSPFIRYGPHRRFRGRVADRRCTTIDAVSSRTCPATGAVADDRGGCGRRPDRRQGATDRRRQRFHRRKPGDPRRAARARLRRGLRPLRPRAASRVPPSPATSPQPGSRGGRRDELRKRQSDNTGAGAMRVSTVRLPDPLIAALDVPSGPRRDPVPSTTDDDFRIHRRHGRHVVPGTTS